jgi:hypothetical protein
MVPENKGTCAETHALRSDESGCEYLRENFLLFQEFYI